MSLPMHGWKHYGRPGHRYDATALQLRRAASLSDDAGHALREVAFMRWKHLEPVAAEAVLLWMRSAMEAAK